VLYVEHILEGKKYPQKPKAHMKDQFEGSRQSSEASGDIEHDQAERRAKMKYYFNLSFMLETSKYIQSIKRL
jgi:hypothetical protein